MEPLSIALMVLLIVLSGLFSSAESALLSLTQARVNHLAKTTKNGKVLKKLKDEQGSVVIAILLGNNIVNIAATALATELSLELFNSVGIALATAIMTFVLLTFGEVLPKLFATTYAQSYLLFIAPALRIWVIISKPVVVFYEALIDVIKEYLGKKSDPLVTEEELEEMIKLGELEGEVGRHERDIILAALDLEDFTADDVMVPRDEIFALDEESKVEDLLKEMNKRGVFYTRTPIYAGSIDNITGVVNIKEIIKNSNKRNWKKMKLKNFAYEPLFVSEYSPLMKVLNEMKKKKNLLALVVDERGLLVGLLSIEDILEVLVGDIYDEFEKVKKKIIRTKNGVIADGSTHIEDLEDVLHINFGGEVATLAEFLLKEFKGLPEEGASLTYDGYVFEVLKREGQKIKRVRIKKKVK